MSLPPPALRSCASCAGQTGANLICAGCHTPFYCSRECQKADWKSGGHKKVCKGIARARRDTNCEVQLRAIARVSEMSGGAPDDARCLFCLDGGDATDPLIRGCACRGSFGWSHATCLVKSAEAARAPAPREPEFTAWLSCSTCKQRFTGLVQLRLAIALWAKHARAEEEDAWRFLAAEVYSLALAGAGECAEAVRLDRGNLDARTRAIGPDHPATLSCATNLARSLLGLGECAKAAVLLRTTLAVCNRTPGADEKTTLVVECNLVSAMCRLGEYAEAEALCRGTLEKKRRVFGPNHHHTLITASNLAFALAGQGKHAEAAVIQREVLDSTTRLLGAEHQETLISATNLACSLSKCDKKTEAEQLCRDTLVLAWRALGPTHVETQSLVRLIRHMRAPSLAA